jgi:YVTN family beta-propeller protein
MFVGNNWDGTADIIDGSTFERLGRINTIPDKEERLQEIFANPVRLAFFLAIRQFVGEGNDQYTDDMFTSHDGRFVYVSRPSFADVVAINLRTQEIVWRFPMEGQRSDHMAISPDGTRLLVSDSTANKVHELDTRTGKKTGEFPSGDSPHENNYSKNGELIYHASIGRVYTPTDRGELVRDTTKGQRYFQVVDADSLKILKRWDMGKKLKEAGYKDMDSAVRPMALSPDERYVYFQVSFHHGFVEFDLQEERVRRVANLPLSEEAQNMPREEYLLDSAHHGIAMNAQGTKLCVAGTMSDYAAIVSRETFAHQIASEGEKPYWSTNGPNGNLCWVSYSGDDEVAVIDYGSESQVARIPVGDHPQRVRAGVIRRDLVERLPQPPEG